MGEARQRVADLWDEVVARWLDRDELLPPDLQRWKAGYSGAVDERWYPDPFTGDLRGEQAEPAVVVLGLNPGVGHAALQSREGVWAHRIRDVGYSRCLDRIAFEDPAWLASHGKNSPYWSALMRFGRRWTGDARLAPAQLVNMELYPWHSDRVQGVFAPDREVLDKYLWQPIAEMDVPEVFAFGAPWLKICADMQWPLLARFGPRHAPVPGSDVPGWHLAVHRMPSGQRAVVSAQAGYAGPPGAARLEPMRRVLSRLAC